MAINKYMRAALKALSYGEPDLTENYEMVRKIKELKRGVGAGLAYRTWDHLVPCGDHHVPVRIFAPDAGPLGRPVLLFFHGGGWVTGNIENYSGVCAALAKATGCLVASVDYRLAPEHKFPRGLNDCYAAAQELLEKPGLLGVERDQITLIGDSAGGNLAAAVSLMARDRGGLLPARQILIYPAVYSDHTPASPFPSVRENGTGYLLTSKRVEEYLQLYRSGPEDLQNPYLAPLLAGDFSGQPDTLVITAEYDPLRDEGEEYARRLAFAGNRVVLHRMPDALHGFFSLPARFAQVRRAHLYIQQFIAGDDML
ncbi:alpha/beta hydrolase [Yanshouia hominis]|uniref:Alpha/beta hydrolase n=1 Tax=Yanshouia hominis TaxID=2763673 RepID=A0ABR7NIL3_9FIRM|nr:alpha/beta hydrolase [Yanshouia hominis]MBC8576246.1 alpha/beta hydrolase [Yanshouia hominis]